MNIGEPIKRYTVVPLNNPVPNTPEPAPVRKSEPIKEPAREKEDGNLV
jgi:hypothetical protein